MTQPTTKQQPNLHLGKLTISRSSLIFLAIIMAIMLICGARYFYSQWQFHDMRNDIEKVNKEFIQPAGGVWQWASSVGEDPVSMIIGCAPDVTCPSVSEVWIVPLDTNQQDAYAESILSHAGYTKDVCRGRAACNSGPWGVKDSKEMWVTVEPADNFHDKIPEQNVAPKTWWRVTIHIDAYRS